MKKLLTYSLLVLSGFMLPACGDDDDKQQDPAPVTIEGRWLVTRIEQKAYNSNNDQIGNTKIETSYPHQAITFTSPNAFLEEQAGSPPLQASGTYVFNSNTVDINTPAPLTVLNGQYQIDTLTATRLVMQITIPASGTNPKLNRLFRANKQ